jgi:hypothetical protein
MRERVKGKYPYCLEKRNMDHFLGILEGTVSDPEPDSDSIRPVDPDLDPGGQKCTANIEKCKKISRFEVLDVFFVKAWRPRDK